MEIKLFGIAREIIGERNLTLSTTQEIHTVGELKILLREAYPAFSQLKSLAVAVDRRYAEDSDVIDRNQEIALIPPVSGG